MPRRDVACYVSSIGSARRSKLRLYGKLAASS
jgi:hypothetical protein